MAEAADFSMPDVFANDYLDRIMKKTEMMCFFFLELFDFRKLLFSSNHSTDPSSRSDFFFLS